jgi:HSP20 family protein
MLLTTFDPFTAELDRLTSRAFGPAVASRPVMRMDGIRRDGRIELRFDLPGVEAGSIDVTVDRGVLTVTAQRAQEYAENERPFIAERAMGSFTRRVRLSDAVDAEKIEADYDRGVLTVSVPLADRALPRKVEVTTQAKAEISA